MSALAIDTRPDPLRAAIYTRKSLDRERRKVSVGEQETDSRALCERSGWEVVEVFCDESNTAYGDDRRRPAYDRLVDDVAAGRFDVVVAFHSERLWREPADQALFLALGRAGGLQFVATCNGVTYDPTDPDDEYRATIETAGARLYAARVSMNMKRRQRHKAAAGEWHGGRRVYGFDVERDTNGEPTRSGLLVQVPHEVAVIQECAARVLAGETARAIAIDLNRRGIATTEGRQWRSGTLTQMLVNPTVAGLRSHKGATKVPAQWEGAIDLATHERLVALVAARKRGPRASTARKHVLTGLLRCGRCGGP